MRVAGQSMTQIRDTLRQRAEEVIVRSISCGETRSTQKNNALERRKRSDLAVH